MQQQVLVIGNLKSFKCMYLLPSVLAGIVASDPQVIHSALLLTERHEPHFIAVIDRLQVTSEPEIYKTTQTVSDCLPYLKMLQ